MNRFNKSCYFLGSLLILLLTSGCAGTKLDTFDNRLSLSLAGDKLFINSMYGPLGITSEVSDKDRAALLEAVSK